MIKEDTITVFARVWSAWLNGQFSQTKPETARVTGSSRLFELTPKSLTYTSGVKNRHDPLGLRTPSGPVRIASRFRKEGDELLIICTGELPFGWHGGAKKALDRLKTKRVMFSIPVPDDEVEGHCETYWMALVSRMCTFDKDTVEGMKCASHLMESANIVRDFFELDHCERFKIGELPDAIRSYRAMYKIQGIGHD